MEMLKMSNKKNNKKKTVEFNSENEYQGQHVKPISDGQLDEIRDDIVASHTDIVILAMTDDEARAELNRIVKKEHSALLKNNVFDLDETVEYVVREIAGTGIIEEILKDETVEDITWDGINLVVEKSTGLEWIDTDKFEITEDYINKIISRFTTNVDKDFSSSQPILDAKYKNLRLNAVHSEYSTSGTTLSLRVLREKLALNRDNFNIFAPDYMLAFFEKMILTNVNMTVSGITGTGKTEFQKLLLSMVKKSDKMILIEDVAELQIKEMFPEKLALNWIVSGEQTITKFVKGSLRNKPVYVIVSEVRDDGAYEMLQASLSGHFVITSLHTMGAEETPPRFSHMCAMGFPNVNSELVEASFKRTFDFGCHIEVVDDVRTGKRIRYLAEVMEFGEHGNRTIFKQRYIGRGRYKVEFIDDISDTLKIRMEKKGQYWEKPSDEFLNDRHVDGNDILEKQMIERKLKYEKIKDRYGSHEKVLEVMEEIEFFESVGAYYTMIEEEGNLCSVISDITNINYETIDSIVEIEPVELQEKPIIKEPVEEPREESKKANEGTGKFSTKVIKKKMLKKRN